MKKHILLSLSLLVALILGSSCSNDKDLEREETWTVEWGEKFPMWPSNEMVKAIRITFPNGKIGEGYPANVVEGLTVEDGYVYVVEVSVKPADSPMDGAHMPFHAKLIRIISKTKK